MIIIFLFLDLPLEKSSSEDEKDEKRISGKQI